MPWILLGQTHFGHSGLTLENGCFWVLAGVEYTRSLGPCIALQGRLEHARNTHGLELLVVILLPRLAVQQHEAEHGLDSRTFASEETGQKDPLNQLSPFLRRWK